MRLFVKIDNTYEEITLYGTERIEIFSTFDNLESPTNLNSDYTQPFTAPRCRENNKIFREFVHIDNQLTTYDPTQKMPCLITNDARETIIAGECYLEKVDRDNYHINVNGSLSKVFGKLKDVDFDSVLKKKRTKNKVTNRYELVDSDFYNPLTASNVKLSWVTSRSRHTSYGEINPNTSLIPIQQVGGGSVTPIGGSLSSVRVTEPQYTETEAYINTLIGWSMTDADTYKDFETDKWLVKPNVMNTATEGVAANQTFMSGYYSMRDLFLDNMKDGKSIYDKNTCYYADESPITFDDVSELSMQEFRSYYQHPFLWLKSWAEVFAEKIQSELGYTIDWGGTIEDTAIYMLPRFYDNDARNESTNVLSNLWGNSWSSSDATTFTADHVTKRDLSKTLSVSFNTGSNIILGVPATIQEFKFTPRIRLRDYSLKNDGTPELDSIRQKVFWNGYVNPILVEVGVAQSKQTKKYCFVPFPSNWSNESNYEHIKIHTLTDMYGDLGYELVMLPYECDWDFKLGVERPAFNAELELPITFAVNPSMFNKEDVSMLTLNVKIETASRKVPFYHQNGTYIGSGTYQVQDQTVGIDLLRSEGSADDHVQVKGSTSQRPSNRSGKAINMRNLLKDNDKSIFDILVGYTKLKHAVWVIDESNKTIVVKPCDEYLKEQYQYDGYLDITKNVDCDSLVQYPLSWDARIVRMKHNDNEFVGEYDTMQINTPNFIQDGDSTIDLFEEMNVCVMAQRIRDYYVDLHNVTKMKSPYILPITRGDYANFYAHSNYSNESQHTYWQTSRAKQICSRTDTNRWFITDDTDIETFNNAYCWHSEMMYGGERNNSQFGMYVTRQNCDINGSGFRYNITPTDVTYYTYYDRMSTIKDYITDYDINGASLLYTRPSEYLYDIFGDSRTSFVYDTYKDYLSEVYNPNNRKIVCRAKLNYTEWTRIKRNPFVRYGDILCMVTSIEFWNENDKLCDITMRRIDNLEKLVKLDPIVLGSNCSLQATRTTARLNIYIS
ncbi:MAG: hypothetical protein KBS62_08200 [Oscillospiraceae bacterium]|nr:hypothetical protein [Candidatus Ruminococcus equi]